MPLVYVLHVAAGGLALAIGYTALFAPKGGAVHRRAGMGFVYAMLAMCGAGFTLALVRNAAPWVNVSAATVTAYLVVTSLAVVRPPAEGSAVGRALLPGAMIVALVVGSANVALGFEAVAVGVGRDGMPAFPFFLFGVIGLLGAIGDARVLRSGPPTGAIRLARHLWRMTFALFIAAMSFFIGQAKVIPAPIRIVPLLALPVLTVLVALLYWMWRVRIKRSLHGLATSAVGSRPPGGADRSPAPSPVGPAATPRAAAPGP